MPKSDFHFFHPLRVRWSEVDRQGVVFFGNYLNYFDVSMTEYMRSLGFPYPQGLIDRGTDLYVVKTETQYHGAVQYDDMLQIHTRIARLGRTSLTFAFEVYREHEDALLASGQIVYVNVDITQRQSAVLPEELAEKVRHLEGI